MSKPQYMTCTEFEQFGDGQVVDYYGDGSKFVKLGVHYAKDGHGEPCVHD